MLRIAFVVFIALIAVTYFNDPTSFRPWEEVAGHVSVVVAKAVRNSGETASKFIRDETHKDSVIDKAKDAVTDTGNSVKQAVTGN